MYEAVINLRILTRRYVSRNLHEGSSSDTVRVVEAESAPAHSIMHHRVALFHGKIRRHVCRPEETSDYERDVHARRKS